MAGFELTDLTADTSPSSNDIGYSVKDPGGTPLDRKVTWLDVIKAGALGVLTSNGDLLTRAAGAITRITRADLAADSAFSTVYAPIGSFDSALGADVTVSSTAGTWVDGPAVTVGAGTWLIVAHATIIASGTGAETYVTRVYNGTAAVSSAESTAGAASFRTAHSHNRVVSPAGSTTYTLQVTANGTTSGTLKATTPSGGNQPAATTISAVKIAP